MALSKKKRPDTRNIGIKANPPIKKCADPKCPWHGNLSLRGRIFEGIVTSVKGIKTAVVKWGYVFYIPKYERYERRNTKVVAYRPECIELKVGDRVRIMECRPLSKTKSFAVIEKIENKR